MFRSNFLLSFLLILFFGCSPAVSFSQKNKEKDDKGKQEVKKAKIEASANSLEFIKRNGQKDAKRLIGNVKFRHQGVDMYCDSAYLYPNNSLEAFSNVRILQGDSLQLYGDNLKYDGNTRLAEVTKNVRLSNKDMNLTTDYITFDMKSNIASYHNKGTLVSKENTLTSEHGYYNSKSKEFSFKKNVVLNNPQYVVNCDTLKYNTFNKVAYFLGPTTIKSTREYNVIKCENGWYDTDKDISQFSRNAVIVTKKQVLKGDSLYYDRKKGFGKAIKNISIRDSAENITITGNYAVYYEETENSIVTNKAILIQVYAKDTLFLHADTLRACYEMKDSAKKKIPDLNKRMLFAFHHVKFFKSDMQGKCDSLVYSNADSTMRLFKDPVMWSEKNQLTGEKVELQTANGQIGKLKLINNAFIVSAEDSIRFNQIKGKMMNGTFVNNTLHRVKVEGNGQTVYYAKEKSKYIGVNKADCTDILIILKDNEVSKITFITKPAATLFPIKEADPKEFILKDMKPRFEERPGSKNDIFN